MRQILLMTVGLLLIIPTMAFAESQTLSTDKGTLDVKLSYDDINPGDQQKLNIDFINPESKKIQQHIDYIITVFKDDKPIFGPINLTHTSIGSVKIPVEFAEEGMYTAKLEIEGILFQPIPTEAVSFEIPVGEVMTQSKIPDWIKNNAKWWSEDQIDDSSFVQGIQYLIKEDILKIPPTTQGTSSGSNEIPVWIKNNAGWWADGSIDDDSFVQGIQYLIKEGIMTISNS